MDDVDKT